MEIRCPNCKKIFTVDDENRIKYLTHDAGTPDADKEASKLVRELQRENTQLRLLLEAKVNEFRQASKLFQEKAAIEKEKAVHSAVAEKDKQISVMSGELEKYKSLEENNKKIQALCDIIINERKNRSAERDEK